MASRECSSVLRVLVVWSMLSCASLILAFPECTGSVKIINLMGGQSGSIRSPNYNFSNSGSDEECKWRIVAPHNQKLLIYFTLVDVGECWGSYVRVFDGSSNRSRLRRRGCGDITPAPFYSSDKYLFITFHSDSKGQINGFVAHYRALSRSSGCPLIDPVATAGVIYSPNFPWNYPDSTSCTWTITVPSWKKIMLYIIFFNVGTSSYDRCRNDNVKVKLLWNGKGYLWDTRCGKVRGPGGPSYELPVGGSLLVTFYSDNADSRSGFLAFYQMTNYSFPSTAPPYTTYPANHTRRPNTTFPNYTRRPNTTYTNSTRRWTMATPGPRKPNSNKTQTVNATAFAVRIPIFGVVLFAIIFAVI